MSDVREEATLGKKETRKKEIVIGGNLDKLEATASRLKTSS